MSGIYKVPNNFLFPFFTAKNADDQRKVTNTLAERHSNARLENEKMERRGQT